MNTDSSIFLKNRSITLTEFGYISAVREFEGWIEISNDANLKLRMKKVYHKWPHVLTKCKTFMTKNIKAVTRSGIGASTKAHFNEIYIDPPGARLLAFPADGRNAPNTVEQLIMERVWKQEVWAEDISNKVDLFAEPIVFKLLLRFSLNVRNF